MPASASASGRRAARETLIDRAWALHCEGHKAPAIGGRLGISQRTVRSWIARITADLAAERDATRAQRLALAVERHLAVAAAAWDAYHRAEDLDRAALDDYETARRAHERAAAVPVPTPEDCGVDRSLLDPDVLAAAMEAAAMPPPPPRQPKLATSGARYLALALQAQRAVARLEGLDHYVPEPDKDQPQHLFVAPPDHMLVPDEDVEAWRAFRRHYYANGGVPFRDPMAAADAVERMGDDLARGTLDPDAAGDDDDENPAEKSAESAGAEDDTSLLDPGDLAPYSVGAHGRAPSPAPEDPLDKSAESAESAARVAHERAAAIAARLTPPPSPRRPFPAEVKLPYLIPFEESEDMLRQNEDDPDPDQWPQEGAGPLPDQRTGGVGQAEPFNPNRSYP
jgi:hypothetical protein